MFRNRPRRAQAIKWVIPKVHDMATAVQATVERENYLNVDYSLKSWLLTKDHKRIALLYLISITAMFFVGGFFADSVGAGRVR